MFGWWDGGRRKRMEQRARELERDLKMMESQQNLLNAATSTADAANLVTNRLKARLDDSVAQFENTVRIMNDALIICDLDGRIQAFNPAAEQLFSLLSINARERFIGDLLKTNNFLDTGADVWAMLDNTSGADQMIGTREDGQTFLVDVNHTQLDRSDGTAIVLLVLNDLSPSQASANYRSMFESSFDGILVVKDNKIVAANPAVSYLFGYSTEELLTKTIDSLIFSASNMRVELPVGSPAVNVTVDAVHQHGHHIEVYFTTSAISWNAEPASLITIRDMKPIRAAASVRDNEQPKMICTFNKDYKITFANHLFAEYYGTSSNTLIGLDIRNLMSVEEKKLFQIHIDSLTPQNPARLMQMNKMLADGVYSLQIWSDHASWRDGEVEYQRLGRDLNKTITPKVPA